MIRSGLPIIRTFEGCRLKAYRCPANIPTIGWGRTTNVRMGDTCTQVQADQWLEDEYDAFETGVRKLIGKSKVTDHQLGALVSFAYNVGLSALKSSTLLRKHLLGDYAGAAAEFARWNKAAGNVLAGLTKRRAAEARLYVTMAE